MAWSDSLAGPLHEGRMRSGGSGVLWPLSCPRGGPHWPSLSVPGDGAAVEAQRPLLNLPGMERAGLKGAEMHFPAWSLCQEPAVSNQRITGSE